MKFSKTSVLALVLLLAIVGAEFYYLKYHTHKSDETEKSIIKENISTPIKKHTTTETLMMGASDAVKKEEETSEDEKIISTVAAYQKGYREGCRQPTEADMASFRKESHQSRSYQLGFEKGKTDCLLQMKQKKEHYDLGYKDGCDSAVKKLVKNSALYESSSEYKKGWDRGSDMCSDKRGKVITKKLVGKKESVNKQSSDYQSGYQHGCASARGNYFRMEDLYLRSRDYRQGWTTGRQKCQDIKKSITPLEKRNYFDQGYRDGCTSVKGYYRRDEHKYLRVRSYSEGWRAGEYECGGAF